MLSDTFYVHYINMTGYGNDWNLTGVKAEAQILREIIDDMETLLSANEYSLLGWGEFECFPIYFFFLFCFCFCFCFCCWFVGCVNAMA